MNDVLERKAEGKYLIHLSGHGVYFCDLHARSPYDKPVDLAVVALVREVERLRDAIRTHRDQRGDDRCWRDDQELYAVIGENTGDNALPPRDVFLANCERFYDARCRDAGWRSYQELEAEVARLQGIVRSLADRCAGQSEHIALLAERPRPCPRCALRPFVMPEFTEDEIMAAANAGIADMVLDRDRELSMADEGCPWFDEE